MGQSGEEEGVLRGEFVGLEGVSDVWDDWGYDTY